MTEHVNTKWFQLSTDADDHVCEIGKEKKNTCDRGRKQKGDYEKRRERETKRNYFRCSSSQFALQMVCVEWKMFDYSHFFRIGANSITRTCYYFWMRCQVQMLINFKLEFFSMSKNIHRQYHSYETSNEFFLLRVLRIWSRNEFYYAFNSAMLQS